MPTLNYKGPFQPHATFSQTVSDRFFIIAYFITTYIYLLPRLYRPARTPQITQLFEGITYNRSFRESPRPALIHVVTIDLTVPGINFFVTPGQSIQGRELSARTTSEFLDEFDLQLAVNGDFFEPFYASTPWSFYPRRGDPVDVLGLAISNGETYSTSKYESPALCILSHRRAVIQRSACPLDTVQAISGNDTLIDQGRPKSFRGTGYANQPHPRTVLAVDERGETVWILVVDGRQDGYSEGVTLTELVDLVVDIGAYDAINLDGGGSTTLVMEESSRPQILNAPIHTRIPMRQRPIANHLGVYARPYIP